MLHKCTNETLFWMNLSPFGDEQKVKLGMLLSCCRLQLYCLNEADHFAPSLFILYPGFPLKGPAFSSSVFMLFFSILFWLFTTWRLEAFWWERFNNDRFKRWLSSNMEKEQSVKHQRQTCWRSDCHTHASRSCHISTFSFDVDTMNGPLLPTGWIHLWIQKHICLLVFPD